MKKIQTIEKILKYKSISETSIYELEKIWFYNGTGTDWLNFDELIDNIFEILKSAKIFKRKKAFKLRKDIEQLVLRHDIDTKFKIWLFYSWRRLAVWLFKLLHHFSLFRRFILAVIVMYAVTLTPTARENYKLIK